MADNTEYLKFEARSMLDFLKQKVRENGTYTDQIYSGSNMSILLETLSTLFEVLTYNLNFQASEATFNGAQIYENMLKIVGPLGYKARPPIASTIIGTMTGKVYLDKLMPNITPLTNTINDLVDDIRNAIIIASNPKILTKNLVFNNASGTSKFSLLENTQVYPEFTSLEPSNIFYWTDNAINESDAILQYLRSIWNLPSITLDTTIDEMIQLTGLANRSELIEKYKTLPKGKVSVPCNFRTSSSDIDNFITGINGGWNALVVTDSTAGEQNESFNITSLNVDGVNASDGSFYAALLAPDNDTVSIYKSVSNLKVCGPNDKAFEAYVDINKCITIKFGDNVYGESLPENHTLILFYIVNQGKAGEVAPSAFTNNSATLTTGSVLERSSGFSDVPLEKVINKFIYDNALDEDINATNTHYVSKLITSSNGTGEFVPKLDVYFNPVANSSNYQPIETVDEIRSNAPAYIRTNDRVISKNDLYILLRRNYPQFIYDTVIMNNFEYMSKFYKWLYDYNSLSKDSAADGYKYADSCNFNDIYIWIKGHTQYPVSDYIKKTIDRTLEKNKILTAELVYLDSIATYFYPYVGDINNDIDWLLYALDKYKFLIKVENDTDPYYRKWKAIYQLFNTENGTIIREPTKRLIEYILSGTAPELKVGINVYRDLNINESLTTIKTGVSDIVNKAFSIQNNKLGKSISLAELNDSVSKVAGVRRVRTTKYRNLNLYTTTGPVVKNAAFNHEGSTNSIPITFDVDYDYPLEPTSSNFTFEFDLTALASILGDDYLEALSNGIVGDNGDEPHIEFYEMNLSTGIERKLQAEVSKSSTGNYQYVASLKFEGEDDTAIITEEPRNYSAAHAIYVRAVRTQHNKKLYCYSNKLHFSIASLNLDGTPAKFKLKVFVDNFTEASITLKDAIDMSSTRISDSPIWEVTDSAYSLSFAKFTNKLINGKDFEVVGSGIGYVEDFCFPTLYRDITNIISINDERNATFGVNF